MTQPNTWWYPILPTLEDPNVTLYASALDAKTKGVPVDNYDTSKPLRLWNVSAAYAAANQDANGNLNFTIFDAAYAPNASIMQAGNVGYGKTSQFTIPATEATGINYPGAFWAPYTTAPTDATMNGPAGPYGPADPNTLCTLAEAQAVAAEASKAVGRASTVAETPGGYYYISYPSTETRRQYTITFDGLGQYNAKNLLLQKNAHGIGSPGHWAIVIVPGGASAVQWVFDAPPSSAPATEATAPTPIRPLLANEVIVYCIPGLLPGSNPFPGTHMQFVVERTDIAPPSTPNPTPVIGSASLDQVYADTQAIRAKLGA